MSSIDSPTVSSSTNGSSSGVYYRLIALWVLCEAMLGGIIHGFRIPVSGLVVGSSAVICICLIGWYMPVRGAIIRATLIVAIFKMMLSPQAPPTAYIAVFFQGALGEILFFQRRYYRAACLVLAIFALLESALQRILVVTIIYGNDLWQVLNDSIYRIGGNENRDYSYFIMLWYVLAHLIMGVLVGIWAGFLPQRIELLGALEKKYHITPVAKNESEGPISSRKRKIRWGFILIWMGLLVFWIQSEFGPGKPWIPAHVSLRILVRSLVIIMTWYLFLGPLLRNGLQSWLRKKQNRSEKDIKRVVEQLPLTRHIVIRSWQLSAGEKGVRRWLLCVRIILANTFHNAHG